MNEHEMMKIITEQQEMIRRLMRQVEETHRTPSLDIHIRTWSSPMSAETAQVWGKVGESIGKAVEQFVQSRKEDPFATPTVDIDLGGIEPKPPWFKREWYDEIHNAQVPEMWAQNVVYALVDAFDHGDLTERVDLMAFARFYDLLGHLSEIAGHATSLPVMLRTANASPRFVAKLREELARLGVSLPA